MSGLLGVLLTVLAAPPGPCDLVDRAAVTQLLGHPITAMSPTAETADDETSGMLSYCSYRGGPAGLVVSVVRFASPAEARKATTRRLVAGRLEEETTTVEEEAGLGDKAFWAYNDEGAEWVVLKGAVVVGVALGGRTDKPPKTLKWALRDATAAVVAKV